MPINRCLRCTAFAVWPILLASAASAQAGDPDTSWIDQTAISAGEVSLRVEKDERRTLVDTAILVDSPPRLVWDVLVACDIAPEYVPNVIACRSIDTLNDGRSELFIQTVKAAIFIPAFEHVFRMDYEPYSRIDVSRVSGPIKLLEGTWWLLEREDGQVLLIYKLLLDPGIPVPRFFVRATLRRDLPIVLKAVKERAEQAARARD